MPTTAQFALSAPRSTMKKLDPFAHIGFGILMLWAVIMLSIGAAAQFGVQSPEISTVEIFTLF
jgi:hypothetical protein